MLLVRIMLFFMSRGAPAAEPVATLKAVRKPTRRSIKKTPVSSGLPIVPAPQTEAYSASDAEQGGVTREEMLRLFGGVLKVR